VPVSSFPFPTYYPDTGTGSEDSNRTYVGPLTQPLLKEALQRLMLLYTLSPTHPPLRASVLHASTIARDGLRRKASSR
jgi:hypothetical protein